MYNLRKGFSLIELLIYLGILAIIGVAFSRVLSVATRVQISEVAADEIANQTNFVMQTIQRLVRDSSAIIVRANPNCITEEGTLNADTDSGIGVEEYCLKLRMQDSSDLDPNERDPIYIYKEPGTGIIKLIQGINQVESNLTTSKASHIDNVLTFKKFTNYPGRDSLQVSLTLNYNSPNPQAKAKKITQTAVSRVSAATFDSDLFPGDTNYQIGSITQRWTNLFLSGNLDVQGTIMAPGNFDNAVNGRGMMTLFVKAGSQCDLVCEKHTGPNQCFGGYAFSPTGLGGTFILAPYSCDVAFPTLTTGGGLCMCY